MARRELKTDSKFYVIDCIREVPNKVQNNHNRFQTNFTSAERVFRFGKRSLGAPRIDPTIEYSCGFFKSSTLRHSRQGFGLLLWKGQLATDTAGEKMESIWHDGVFVGKWIGCAKYFLLTPTEATWRVCCMQRPSHW